MDSQQLNYVIPDSLSSHVVFVDGLLNKKVLNEIFPKQNLGVMSNDVDPGFVGTESLRKLYNIPNMYVNESLVAVEYQNQSGFSNIDLITSQRYNGLTVNPISARHSIGFDDFPDTETELDVQMESQLADGQNCGSGVVQNGCTAGL